MSTYCIIIPCYNEANRLNVNSFRFFLEKHTEFKLLFVNDGSSDTTLESLKQLSIANDQISYLDMPQNQGKAEAVRRGMLKSLSYEQINWVGYLDADLATPLEEWYRLAQITADQRWVAGFGSRVLLLGTHVKRNTWRHYLGRVFATIISLITHVKIYDSQCGAKVFSSEIVLSVFDEEFTSRWFFDVELLFRLKKIDPLLETVGEVPLQEWVEKGESKLKIRDFLLVPRELWRIWMRYG